ncbi:MAG: BTAD domain-containing putative transcriptional regulator [Gemmatimonadales bacterium]
MLRLTTLGALDLRDRLGHPIRDVLAQPKRMALLAYLVLEGRKGPISRDHLLAMFWPESDDARARNALSQALHHLRQSLGSDLIESQGANVLLVHGDALWCDAVVFGEAAERGEPELALDVYRGDFCPTLYVSGAPEAEAWLETERRKLRERALSAARSLAERLAAKGDPDGAARTARRALAMRPDDEADVRAMLGVLDRAGDAAGALSAYQDFAKRIAEDLELEPAAETKRLVDAIRRRREQVATTLSPDAPAPAEPSREVEASRAPAAAPTSVRRLRRVGLATGLLVLLAMAASLLLRRGGAPPAAAAEETVAVFPFTVRGGANIGYLREGMVDLLSAKLEGASGFHAIDPRTVVAAAGRTDSARAIENLSVMARRLGAGRYISGEVVEIAGRLQIAASLFELAAGPRAVASATVTGDTTHLFELVDDLTGRILAGLVHGRDTTLTRLAALTTTSLPALKAYLEGEQAMRAGRDGQAAAAFSEAVALDSTFALAEYRLANSAVWITVPGAENAVRIADMATLAERHAKRLAPLVRDLLAAYRAYKEFRPDDAERMYRRLVETHPDNVEASFMLGETYFHYNPLRGRSPVSSRAMFEHVLALDPTNAHAILHLARVAAFDGRVAALDSLAAVFQTHYRGAERTLEMRALIAAVHDDPAERRAVVRDAAGADGIVLMSVIQSLVDYAQNPDAARELAGPFMRSVSDTIPRLFGRRMFTLAPLAMGRWNPQEAVQLLGPDADLAWLRETEALLATMPLLPLPRPWIVALRDTIAKQARYRHTGWLAAAPEPSVAPEIQAWLVGLLSARLGDTVAVRRALASLAAPPSGRRRIVARALASAVRAEAARVAGRPAAALAELRDFPFGASDLRVEGQWGTHERFLMGDLLVAQGRDSAALTWYESVPAGYDYPWLAPAHFRQGQIYERLGNAERARFHYGRVVRMWSTADPEFQPIVAQARAALARLGR